MANILIIEDDKKTAQQIANELKALGHSCTLNGSGEYAMDAVHKGDFDLLVLDIMLPKISGFEICRSIRREPALYNLPILIISAMNNDEEVKHGLAQGADDYVPKPYQMRTLIQRIESLLRATSVQVGTDEVTGMNGSDYIKREVQRRVCSSERFALIHSELLQLREFGQKYGHESRVRAIRHFARGIRVCIPQSIADGASVAHMGGGFFISLLPTKQAKTFGARLRQTWLGHLEGLFTAIGHTKDFEDIAAKLAGGGQGVMLDVLSCVTLHDSSCSVPPERLFESVSQMRAKALKENTGGVFLDQRSPKSTGARSHTVG